MIILVNISIQIRSLVIQTVHGGSIRIKVSCNIMILNSACLHICVGIHYILLYQEMIYNIILLLELFLYNSLQ